MHRSRFSVSAIFNDHIAADLPLARSVRSEKHTSIPVKYGTFISNSPFSVRNHNGLPKPVNALQTRMPSGITMIIFTNTRMARTRVPLAKIISKNSLSSLVWMQPSSMNVLIPENTPISSPRKNKWASRSASRAPLLSWSTVRPSSVPSHLKTSSRSLNQS